MLNMFACVVIFMGFYFGFASAQQPCGSKNECNPLIDRSCRPNGACESFCQRLPCMRPATNCFCRQGYARDHNGNCILLAQCTYICGDRECSSNNPSCRCESFCRPRFRCVVAAGGCHCARGYARDNRNVCIPLNMCR